MKRPYLTLDTNTNNAHQEHILRDIEHCSKWLCQNLHAVSSTLRISLIETTPELLKHYNYNNRWRNCLAVPYFPVNSQT